MAVLLWSFDKPSIPGLYYKRDIRDPHQHNVVRYTTDTLETVRTSEPNCYLQWAGPMPEPTDSDSSIAAIVPKIYNAISEPPCQRCRARDNYELSDCSKFGCTKLYHQETLEVVKIVENYVKTLLG